MIRFIWLVVFIFIFSNAFGQSPVAHYEFDCNLQEEGGFYNDVATPFFPNCRCGVSNDAVIINDNIDLSFDTLISAILVEDFAISFYFQTTSTSNSQELFSVGDNCSSDSLMRMYYLESMNEVIFEASESILESVSLRAVIPSNKCWNHVIVSRENNDFYMYINGELADEVNFGSDIDLNTSEPIQFGHGPCVGVISNEFEGFLDNVQFFDEHIQAFRARDLYLLNDEVISSDTTIFLGDIIDVSATRNCSGDILWSPNTGIDNVDSFEISIEGIETTDYLVTFSDNSCVSTDTFKVIVVDPEDVQCDDLILPNVFTPNGDGINDQFGILNGFIVQDLELFQVFDRWGEIVFSTTDKTEKWDGEFNGKSVNSNLLLYKILYTCDGKQISKTGSVSILR